MSRQIQQAIQYNFVSATIIQTVFSLENVHWKQGIHGSALALSARTLAASRIAGTTVSKYQKM
jgi:hypothetical protein